MSNLPMIPGVASAQDVNEMKRLMQLMGGGGVPAVHEQQGQYSGGSQGTRRNLVETAPPAVFYTGCTNEDVNAMKKIMERLEEVNGPTWSKEEEAQQAPVRSNLVETTVGQRALPGARYAVMTTLVESAGKEVRAYDVVPEGSRNPVVEGLVVQEAAQAVVKFLNKGLVLESAKVQEVLELEETYNRNRIEAGIVRGRYTRCVELGESEAAQVFKTRHATVRATAMSAQDQIKSILASIR